MSTYSELKKSIPADQALANKAIQASLEQVKNVFNAYSLSLAGAVAKLESNKNLNLINQLTAPLPPDVVAYYEQNFATGSGTEGTLMLVDVIGTAAGWVQNDSFTTIVQSLTELSSTGALNTLTNPTNGVFTVMQNAIDGDYNSPIDPPPAPPSPAYEIIIPPGLPGAGTYATLDDAFNNGLIPAAQALIQSIVNSNSTITAAANSASGNVCVQLITENENLVKAAVIFSELIAGIPPINLVASIPEYGLDTTEGGAAYVMEAVANIQTQGGQAIVATMREARNQQRLSDAGVEPSIEVSAIRPEPQAPLSSGQYTTEQAISQKII